MAALAAVCVIGCRDGDPAAPLPRDLIREVSSAVIQPAPVPEVVRQGEVTIGGISTPALILTSPARLTWPVRLPERAELHASVTLVSDPARTFPAGVTIRIGFADDRAFEELMRLPVTPGAWQPMRVDLSAYSGWKWSIFFQPSRITWKLIVATDPTPGGSVAWRELALRSR